MVFVLYLELKQLTDPKLKRSILLLAAGSPVQNVYDNLPELQIESETSEPTEKKMNMN